MKRTPLAIALCLSTVLLLPCIVSSADLSSLALPWHCAEATSRVVYCISVTQTQQSSVVTLPMASITAGMALVDARAPDAPLPCFATPNGVSLKLSGVMSPAAPRQLIAYFGGIDSPRLSAPPAATGDYASVALGRAWDFEDGSQCGISGWGNRPHHFGPISVKAGWLQIPVKDSDPYFTFGTMFGAADEPRSLHIDSAAYRYLELRVRQSCPHAKWGFYVTDKAGHYKDLAFEVHGTDAQTFRFDLREVFPDFWDGRIFRALRVDTTNDKRDVLAEVDYVRLLPEPPTVIAGPVFTREALAARDALSRIRPALPKKLNAGERVFATVATGAQPASRLLWAWVTAEHGTKLIESAVERASHVLELPVLTRAGTTAWTFGLADDLGQPLLAVSGNVRVTPAELTSYRLTPAKSYVGLEAPTVTIAVEGLDAFGNVMPVDISQPRWTLAGQVQPPNRRLRGNPASVSFTFPRDAAATHTVTLADDAGRAGTTAVTTVSYRKETIRLNANGCLVTPAGALYFPTGGLYANWPQRISADGTVSRALDLFPCGPSAYQAGFPWSAATETAVAAYLKQCSERGISCLRLMLRNMDLVGRVDPVQLKATLHLFDLARPYGIRFNVALFEDYDKPPYVSRAILEKIVLPQYTPGQLADLPPHRARFLKRKEVLAAAALRYSDPDAMACQRDYLRELIPVLASREEILCYEFENEMVFPPMAWCAATAAYIRSIDPHTLILGNPGPHDWPVALQWRGSGCDLYSYHPYNNGEPPADHGAVIYLRSKFSAQSRLPMYTGEGGINQNRWQSGVNKMTPEASARGARDQIWMSVCCGASGCLYWTLDHDLEAQEFAKVVPALEGIGIDLRALKRQRPPVALALPPDRRDRRDAALAMRLLDLGVDFDTVVTNATRAYAVVIDLAKRAPESVVLPATVAAPAPGWQVATLLSAKNDQALLYLRNVAGGVKDFGGQKHPCHLRDVQPAEAAFTLAAPRAWRSITAFDLNTRRSMPVTADLSGRVVLSHTDHDFVVGLHR